MKSSFTPRIFTLLVLWVAACATSPIGAVAQPDTTLQPSKSSSEQFDKMEKSTDDLVALSMKNLKATKDEKVKEVFQSSLDLCAEKYYLYAETLKSGIEIDGGLPRVIELFKKSALLGYVKAQVLLGLMYETGDEVSKNGEEAAKWLQMAADKDDMRGQALLGQMYLAGVDIPKDYVKAASLLLEAAEKGDTTSQAAVSVLYSYGMGVNRDDVLAYMWANLSAAESDTAKSQREQLENRMAPDQIAEGQALTRKWIAAHPKPQD